MVTAKATARRSNRQELRSVAPLRQLSDAALDLLAGQAEVLSLPQGFRLQQRGGPQTHLLFLLSGELHLVGRGGAIKRIPAGSMRARFPLLSPDLPQLDGVLATASELLRVPVKALQEIQRLATRPPQEPAPPAVTIPSEEAICLEFQDVLAQGRLELPGMPEVAVRIARQIDAPQANNEEIARLIQLDPALTARFLQVANSPAFGGRQRVETCKDAISRLGRQTTRSLVTSFVLRGLFRTRSEVIRARLQALWLHSTQVAALCHALARRTPGFDPAQALLIGLVHDIGVIPILTHANQHPELLQDAPLLERVIARLRADFSTRTLETWGFGPEFVSAAREAEDWRRDRQPQPDYADILLMSQLHAAVGTPAAARLPRLDEVPAFHKLALGRLSPRLSLAVLDEAHQEIEEVRTLLS